MIPFLSVGALNVLLNVAVWSVSCAIRIAPFEQYVDL